MESPVPLEAPTISEEPQFEELPNQKKQNADEKLTEAVDALGQMKDSIVVALTQFSETSKLFNPAFLKNDPNIDLDKVDTNYVAEIGKELIVTIKELVSQANPLVDEIVKAQKLIQSRKLDITRRYRTQKQKMRNLKDSLLLEIGTLVMQLNERYQHWFGQYSDVAVYNVQLVMDHYQTAHKVTDTGEPNV